MAEFLNREASIDIRAELAKAPEPELTPEAFDGGDGSAGQPDTDAHKAQTPAAKPETEAAKAEPEAEADDLTDAAGKPLPPDEARKIALRRERQRAKELETQLAEARETKARMEERWRTMQEMAAAQWQQEQAQQPAQNADPEPDRYADPIGHNEWALRQQRAELDALKAQTQQRQAMDHEQRQFQAVRGAFAAKAAEFAAKEPAFKEAYDHLTQSRFNELVMMGFEPNAAQQTILREEAIIVAQWLQRGENPAAKAFELAKLRGFAPKAPEPPPAPAVQPGVEKVKLQAERNAAAASLSAAGGAPPDNGLSLEDIARLPPDEFRKRMAGDGWAKMVGGRAPRMFGGR